MEATQPRCTVLQKLWLLPSEGAPAGLQTLAGLGGCPQQSPELLFSFGHMRAASPSGALGGDGCVAGKAMLRDAPAI